MRRVYEHKQKQIAGFTRRYNINKLVYYEVTSEVNAAISYEKRIKGLLRSMKIALIESINPKWCDLSAGWYDKEGDSSVASLHQNDKRRTRR